MEKMERKTTIFWDDPKISSRNVESITGLDYLKGIQSGSISPPPVAMLIGYKISEVANGYAVFKLEPNEYHLNSFSVIHGGIISTILDSAMTASVISTLPKGVSCSTAEIKVNFVRPITVHSGILRCEARPIHIGKRLATAEGQLKDKKNNIYAHGLSTCLILGTD
jgi:uncharacterized protein (TIGR00369 family)